jgi:hypothetical protein
MSDSDLEFAAWDELYSRPSLVASPLTLVVRGAEPERLQELCARAFGLLAKRRLPDELLLLVDSEPPCRPPRRFGRFQVRTAVLPAALDGAGLQYAIANAAWPVLVTADPAVSLTAPDLDKLLASLETADVVVGRRMHSAPPGVFGRLADWAVRKTFGVPTRDPLSPIKALRRDAARGIPLDCAGPLGDFELLAKLTFVTAIHDDPELTIPADPRRSAFTEVRRGWSDAQRLFSAPTFFSRTSTGPAERRRPQECGPPDPRAVALLSSERFGRRLRPRVTSSSSAWSRRFPSPWPRLWDRRGV